MARRASAGQEHRPRLLEFEAAILSGVPGPDPSSSSSGHWSGRADSLAEHPESSGTPVADSPSRSSRPSRHLSFEAALLSIVNSEHEGGNRFSDMFDVHVGLGRTVVKTNGG
mmetsp:Transcript_85412/g.265550  ORF Transcript_85412/g.265550 Transcript_85412/m.265550 type:complete len:112 (+) Transcript_85412:81-416(+)